MFNKLIRWFIRFFGYEQEIRDETRASISGEIEELRAWVTTASGRQVHDENPEIDAILCEIRDWLELNRPISSQQIRSKLIDQINERRGQQFEFRAIIREKEITEKEIRGMAEAIINRLYYLSIPPDGVDIPEPAANDLENLKQALISSRRWLTVIYPSEIENLTKDQDDEQE